MTQNNCVVRCTADGRIVEISPLELHILICDADEHVRSLHGAGERATYYQRLATVCESTRNYGQAIMLLRKALAQYCRHDVKEMTQHYGRAAKSCAARIDRLRRLAFGGEQLSIQQDVVTFYSQMYWLRLLDEKPEVWDLYCDAGRIPELDQAQWQLIVRQLTLDSH